jgi:RimJ/RimL family protein N-acetyltransferase
VEPPQPITTERLLLRRTRLTDAAAVFDYASDPEVTRYLTFTPKTRQSEASDFLRKCDAAWSAGDAFALAITHLGDENVLGVIEARSSVHGVELAYVLRRSAWGNGYMTEAARAVIDSALGDTSVFRVWAYVDTHNVASQRVLDRVGMIREGTLHRWMVHPNVADEPSDVFMYSLWREA